MLTIKEKCFIRWYGTLTQIERLAVRAWLIYGDARLIVLLYPTSDHLKHLSDILTPERT